MYLKLEGANPTGSFKDRGMTVAVSAAISEGAEAVICASTGNTAASAAAYAARAGLRGAVIVPEGKIATGKLAQALMHGARVIALRGNFDEALALVRQLADRHPIALVNSVNDFRIEGQKTGAFEVCDQLGEPPDVLCIPVGNAGNVTSWWKGFQEYGTAPQMHGYQAEGAAPLVHGARVENPETVASAIRIGNPARWEDAMNAFTASRGEVRAVSDAEILDAYSLLGAREGVFCEPASAASVAGLLKFGAEGRVVCVLTGHGLEGPADRDEPRRERRPVRAGHRERRARGTGMKRRRLVRVPASSANLGPGYDVLAAALSLELELEVEETGEFFVHSDVPGIPTDRSNLCVRAFERLHPADGVTFQIRSEIPASAGLGSSAAAIVAGLAAADHMFELDAPLFDLAVELEGHPDNVAAALHGGFVICPGPGEEPVRFDPPAGLEGVLAIPDHEVPTAEARAAMPAEVPVAEAVHNVGHAALLVLGLAKDDFSLIGRGLHDLVHQPRRRSLYPRSMELVERAEELGAVGATISGAGPTVLFWCHWQQTGGLVERLKTEAPDCDVRRATFSPGGADVREL